MTNLEKLKEKLALMDNYGRACVSMEWDMYTQTPKLGKADMGEAVAFFATEHFKVATSDELYELLKAMSEPEEYEKLDDVYRFTVTKMLKMMEEDRRISPELYHDYVLARTEAETVWRDAKEASDFSMFAPALEKLIGLTKEVTKLKFPNMPVYDALLNQYEEGMLSADIDRVFEELKKDLIPLTKQILAAKQPDDAAFRKHFPKHEQAALCEFLLKYQGFDFDRGSLGETEHPFTLDFSMRDSRIANHYYEDDAISAIFSAIHEGGHAIFGQQVDEKWYATPGQDCTNMGIHESQSRFYENILGRNINFWKPIWPEVQRLLPGFSDITLEEFYHEVNHVRASLIRTEADEVTYCFHVILRYEMEKEIFEKNTPVSELPALWNKKMEEYLGVVPASDKEGILQDSHWSGGSFGYFPSYLLGSIYDGMFLDTIQKELGNLDDVLAEGRILEVTAWLKEKIHQYGNTRKPAEVLEAVCGKQVTSEPLIRYFREKYTEIYNL